MQILASIYINIRSFMFTAVAIKIEIKKILDIDLSRLKSPKLKSSALALTILYYIALTFRTGYSAQTVLQNSN